MLRHQDWAKTRASGLFKELLPLTMGLKSRCSGQWDVLLWADTPTRPTCQRLMKMMLQSELRSPGQLGLRLPS